MDREKVVKGIDICLQRFRCGEDCPYYNTEKIGCMEQLREDALDLLQEQEDLGTELANAVELIHKKNERLEKLLKEQKAQKFFVDESGKITPLPVVVRCKDCKHYCIGHFAFCDLDNRPSGAEWFCADGERKEGDAKDG